MSPVQSKVSNMLTLFCDHANRSSAVAPPFTAIALKRFSQSRWYEIPGTDYLIPQSPKLIVTSGCLLFQKLNASSSTISNTLWPRSHVCPHSCETSAK